MNNLIPHFIADKYSNGILSGSFYAVTMFMDISGFTPMTGALIKNGREGTEILGDILNRIFGPVIDAIYGCNGFVTVFAGDALSAVFIYANDNSTCAAAFDAARCAFEIKDTFRRAGDIETKFGRFKLNVKTGLSAGAVDWGIIGNETQNAYYFSGGAVSAAAVCERFCIPGETVADREFISRISSGIVSREKSSGYYLLEPDGFVAAGGIPQKAVGKIDRAIIEKFAPAAVLNLKASGEFRDIVSCFISFEPRGNISDHVNKLVAMSCRYGGYFGCLDFGDKGGIILVIFGAPRGRDRLFDRAASFAQNIIAISDNGELFPLKAALAFGTVFAGFVGSAKRCEYSALGPAVNLSARMAAAAGRGELWIEDKFRENIGNAFEISPTLEMKFKGIEEKIPIYKLGGRKGPQSGLAATAKIFGREKELELALKYFAPLEDKKFAGVVYIDGAAGSGKTRFGAELKREMTGRRYGWFHMPCDAILQKSFNPFVYFLKNYFDQNASPDVTAFENKLNALIEKTRDSELAAELSSLSSFLGALIGVHRKNSRCASSAPAARYNNTIYAIKALIKAECGFRPVVVEIEDGHWIDKDSIALLKILTRNVELYPFIIISQCRYNDDGGRFSFGLKDAAEKRVAINSLDGLSARSMAAASIGGNAKEPVPKKTLDFIFERSGGNPFYIEQIVNYLKENSLFDAKFKLSRAGFEIPTAISSIIVARLDRLAFKLKETARTASVLGNTFSVNILLAMLAGSNAGGSGELQMQLGEGERQLLWETLSEMEYIFRHSLIRESIYSMQLKKHLRVLHGLAGEAIESLYHDNLSGRFDELANHYESAENYAKAERYLQKAAEQAVKNYHNETAAAFYDRLLKLLDKRKPLPCRKNKNFDRDYIEKKEEILCARGKILEVTGEWNEAEKIFREVLKLSLRLRDTKRVANAYLYRGIIASCKGDFRGSLKFLFRSLELYERIRDAHGVSKVAGHMGYIYLSVSELDRSIECFNRKLAICRRRGDSIGVSHAVGNLGVIYFRLGKNARAMKCYEKQLKISEKLGEKRTISAAIGNMGTVHLVNGRFADALKCYRRQKKIASLLGNLSSVGVAVGNIGVIHFLEGRYKRSLGFFEEHLRISKEIGDRYGMAIATGNTGEVHRILENFEKSEACLKEAIRIKTEINSPFYLCQSQHCMAELLYDMKRFNEAAKFCNDSLKTARAAHNHEYMFKAKLLGSKIKFEDRGGIKEKYNLISSIADMLAAEKNTVNSASLNFELYRMYSAVADDKKAFHKKAALRIYKKLYLKTPDHEYKQRIEVLEKSG